MNPASIHYARPSDNVNIAYTCLGDGPPIVFASNIFGDAHLYRAAWPHVRGVTDQLVAHGWRVIRYDHRGMGSSDREVADLGLTARVEDLEAVVGRVGPAALGPGRRQPWRGDGHRLRRAASTSARRERAGPLATSPRQ